MSIEKEPSSMPHDPKKCLFDIIEACKRIQEFTSEVDYEGFVEDALVKSAVHMQFIIIGEALMRIRSMDSTLSSRITESDRIISFRNVIAHGYDDVVVDEVVWEVTQEKVPVLLSESTDLFNNLPSPEEEKS